MPGEYMGLLAALTGVGSALRGYNQGVDEMREREDRQRQAMIPYAFQAGDAGLVAKLTGSPRETWEPYFAQQARQREGEALATRQQAADPYYKRLQAGDLHATEINAGLLANLIGANYAAPSMTLEALQGQGRQSAINRYRAAGISQQQAEAAVRAMGYDPFDVVPGTPAVPEQPWQGQIVQQTKGAQKDVNEDGKEVEGYGFTKLPQGGQAYEYLWDTKYPGGMAVKVTRQEFKPAQAAGPDKRVSAFAPKPEDALVPVNLPPSKAFPKGMQLKIAQKDAMTVYVAMEKDEAQTAKLLADMQRGADRNAVMMSIAQIAASQRRDTAGDALVLAEKKAADQAKLAARLAIDNADADLSEAYTDLERALKDDYSYQGLKTQKERIAYIESHPAIKAAKRRQARAVQSYTTVTGEVFADPVREKPLADVLREERERLSKTGEKPKTGQAPAAKPGQTPKPVPQLTAKPGRPQ